ncbi:sensor histidine kinase [Nocardioides albidus]|uniref:histidine kinase n=1 Tax=Nocardioides albidus TaxID=1517589 RepID=A0A5C4VKY9_9ACTN|nr:sensor histidine kinase [Nocardioides albidus]TNM36345.1 sensor histidine kinase [Nocardioides albidus]
MDPLASAGNICTVLAALGLLASALVLSFDARLTQSRIRARLATAATLVAVQDLPLTVVAITDPSRSGFSHRITAGHLVTILIVLAVLSDGARRDEPPRLNPMLAGLLLGSVALGGRLAVLADPTPFLTVGHPVDVAVLVAITVLVAAAVLQVLRSPLPRWAALRVSGAMFVLFAARLGATAAEATSPPPAVIVGVVACSALLATTVTSLLLSTLLATRSREATLLLRATAAEATVQHDREVVHELRSATAGIVAGVQLLAGGRVPPGPRRRALEQMVGTETARMGRAFDQDEPEELTRLCVDDVVEPLVVAQEALGHPVAWHRSGHHVVTRHDALSEVLRVLLDNARRHGHGQRTTVTARPVGDTIELRVSDSGPGIEPHLHDRIFHWGVRGTSSHGQGIGLQRAHRLMLELGGSLDHDRNAAQWGGATFVVTLPAAERGTVATGPATLIAPVRRSGPRSPSAAAEVG